jgi:hypothetical protein
MRTRKTDGALEGHVDVKYAYETAHNHVFLLCGLIAQETMMHGRRAKKSGLTFAHVGDLAALRRSLVEVLAQFAQQDQAFVWKRMAHARRVRK